MKLLIKGLISSMVISFFTVIYVKAQVEISGEVLGAVTHGEVNIHDMKNLFTERVEGNNIYGFETGMYAKIRVNPFYIKPALLYNYRYGDVSYQNQPGGINDLQTVNFKLHKLEIPLLLGINIIGPFSVEGGPFLNYILSVTEKYDQNNLPLGKSGIGYRVGVAFEIRRLMLYMSHVGPAYTSGINKATLNESSKFIFGLGFRIFGNTDGCNMKNTKNCSKTTMRVL